MPLLNDVARCQGEKIIGRFVDEPIAVKCNKRETCARYVERHTGSERTPNYAYLCLEDYGDYIQVKKDGKTTENL